MIQARVFNRATIAKAYDHRSWLYSVTVAKAERDYHRVAMAAAAIQPGEDILEVAVGPGLSLLDLARAAGPKARLAGVDLSPKMVAMTSRRLAEHGIHHADLRVAHAAELPFADASFDVLYNAYMLDLVTEEEMPGILAEFRRVLRPGGRVILLNMSKPENDSRDWRESLYKKLPGVSHLYLAGGCRPVLMESFTRDAGFSEVSRCFIDGGMPSELVVGNKPQECNAN